tara:strand:- start:258 stop:1283 length:1026 start_codon:yes stop_codon:yes gene_type:complete
MATLAEIRAKLAQQEQGAQRTQSNGGDNAIFAHWNIPEGTSATLRFLPDADDTNTFFWKERQMIRLSFPGVKGQDENKQVTVQVPCVEMWGEQCPVHAEIRPWFKDPAMEDMGRKYWKKRSYVFQGFVTQSEHQEESVPENPIRRFVISPQIYKIISSALMDPEFQEIPTDYEAGTDFKIVKSTKGQYADYSTSNWARRERSLDQAERDAIATHGLFNLNDFLPKKPNAEELNAIFEMFEASVDGQMYDVERFGAYYRPYGVDAPAGTAPSTPAPAPTPVADTTPAPVAEAAPAETPSIVSDPAPAPQPAAQPEPAMATAGGDDQPSAQDILAAIRSRKSE